MNPLSRWNEILKLEGYSDWTIKIIHSGGGLCVYKAKEIWIDQSHVNSLAWFLHEMAHIKHRGHSALWADHFTMLLDKHMRGVRL